jgi:ABC-2 type transport system permease protein
MTETDLHMRVSIGETLAKLATGTYIIWLRDLKRFFRDRIRLLGAFAQPLIYLFILGTGLQSAFTAFGGGQTKYITFMYPGIVAMTILFTAMFSAISIIWDREFGFLKEMMVAPIPRSSIALGKVFGGGTTALIQGFILLLFMPLAGIPYSVEKLLMMLMVMMVLAVGLTAMGVLFASRMRSMEGFPIVMNFFLLPMFFLSGAFFPLQDLPGWMTVLTKVNPMTYAVDALRGVALKGITVTSSGLNINIPKPPPELLANPQFTSWYAQAQQSLAPLQQGVSRMAELKNQYYPLSLDLLIVLGVGVALTLLAVWRFNRQE